MPRSPEPAIQLQARLGLASAAGLAGLAVVLGATPGEAPDPAAAADPPETTIDSGPQGTTRGGRPTFTFSAGDHAASFECRFDGGAFAACRGPGASHRPRRRLTPGRHTFEVRAIAPGGGVDPTPARRSFRYRPLLNYELARTRVRPAKALFDGKVPTKLRYRFRATRRVDIRIEVVRAGSGRVVKRWVERGRAPRRAHVRKWRGARAGGGAVADGRYRFRVGPRKGRLRPAGQTTLRGHTFPVSGSTGTRGPIGGFGAPRTGGRRHEGFDILAPCGRAIVAARGGRVAQAGYDPVLHGHFVRIRGRAEDRTYAYSHLRSPSAARTGARVRTGERIGSVGQTGNARSTPCHLHFEIRTPGGPIDPRPKLRRWPRW